jgi:hypothetical protein
MHQHIFRKSMREEFEHAIHQTWLKESPFLHHPMHQAFVTQLALPLCRQAHSIPKAVSNLVTMFGISNIANN